MPIENTNYRSICLFVVIIKDIINYFNDQLVFKLMYNLNQHVMLISKKERIKKLKENYHNLLVEARHFKMKGNRRLFHMKVEEAELVESVIHRINSLKFI